MAATDLALDALIGQEKSHRYQLYGFLIAFIVLVGLLIFFYNKNNGDEEEQLIVPVRTPRNGCPDYPGDSSHCPRQCSPFLYPDMYSPQTSCSDPFSWGFTYSTGRCPHVYDPQPRRLPSR